KAATSTIPIVFSTGSDPVKSGLVQSLNRPGGNLTGMTTLNRELSAKRLELLRDLVPGDSTLALMVDPSEGDAESQITDVQEAALHALIAHRLVLRGIGFDLGAVKRNMAELHQAGGLAQVQNLRKQRVQRLQMPLAEFRDGTEVRRIEPHNAHEIDALAARLGNTARGINAAAIRIEQQRRHHDRIERWL